MNMLNDPSSVSSLCVAWVSTEHLIINILPSKTVLIWNNPQREFIVWEARKANGGSVLLANIYGVSTVCWRFIVS